jgi:lipoic acid synthetase
MTDKGFPQVKSLVDVHRLHTVCEEARCPNRHECWNKGTATVMILGDTCTRSCAFCSVKSGRPQGLDLDEPRRVALAAKGMDVKHLVITSVNRDDLPDGGAEIFAQTIRQTRDLIPGCNIEVLTPDFEANREALETVFAAAPAVFNHNLETVKRLQPVIRPQANYGRSLFTLQLAAAWRPEMEVKSGLMVGLGESDEEIREALVDLHEAGCSILTIGQYLRPTRDHFPVQRYVEPARFEEYAAWAREIGFYGIASGPFVRSSYRSEELYAQAREARARAKSTMA